MGIALGIRARYVHRNQFHPWRGIKWAKACSYLVPLGASVGFGVQQAMQMLGSQTVGFASGEWRAVGGTPRRQMYLAIILTYWGGDCNGIRQHTELAAQAGS